MTNVVVVILTGNEELHLVRCLERLDLLKPGQVVVVESQKGDDTHEVAMATAKKLGWSCVSVDDSSWEASVGKTRLDLAWHDWPGNQAEQFNWALDNLEIEGEWILRLDADEYLTPELVEELKGLLTSSASFNGVELPLARTWRGTLLKHEAGHVVIPRIFRRGYGRYEQREMDEKLVIEGEVVRTKNCFVDDNLKSFDWWKAKHRAYAKKEARSDLVEAERIQGQDPASLTPSQRNKAKYRKLPLFVRPFIYALYRYFAWGVWKDGWAGLDWTLWQGLWYRWIVDCEIVKLRKGVK